MNYGYLKYRMKAEEEESGKIRRHVRKQFKQEHDYTKNVNNRSS